MGNPPVDAPVPINLDDPAPVIALQQPVIPAPAVLQQPVIPAPQTLLQLLQ